MLTDEQYMRQALDQARQAADAGEVPIGAVVVSPAGAVIGRGRNMTEQLCDVTAHAEMLALTAATQTLGGKYITGCTLYVTVEPCMMCAGALGWSQVSRIVYGTADPRRGFTSLVTPTASPLHPRTTVTAGILAQECLELMQTFFRSRRH